MPDMPVTRFMEASHLSGLHAAGTLDEDCFDSAGSMRRWRAIGSLAACINPATLFSLSKQYFMTKIALEANTCRSDG